jgi:hypothetical protein
MTAIQRGTSMAHVGQQGEAKTKMNPISLPNLANTDPLLEVLRIRDTIGTRECGLTPECNNN